MMLPILSLTGGVRHSNSERSSLRLNIGKQDSLSKLVADNDAG